MNKIPNAPVSESAQQASNDLLNMLDSSDEATDSRETRSKAGFPARKNWMVLWAAGAVLALVVGFLAGFLMRSPLDEAVENSATELTATAQVAVHEFKQEVTEVQGVVKKGNTVALPEFVLPDGETPIVTEKVAKAGETLTSGSAVLYVAGQPVLVLKLPFALYRDLKPGASGQDVVALQKELNRLGHYTGPIDGEYGSGVASAVRALFTAAGAEPPVASQELVSAYADAQEAYSLAAKRAASLSPISDSRVTEDNGSAETSSTSQSSTDTGSSDSTSAELDQLRRDLATAQRQADTPLLKYSIISVPSKKVEVVELPSVGTTLTGDTQNLKIRSEGTTVSGRFGVLEAESFALGDSVSVFPLTNINLAVQGTITSISDFKEADTSGEEKPGHDFVVTLDPEDASELSDNDSVSISKQDSLGEGERALAVPVTAVRQDVEGTYVFTVANPKTAADSTSYSRVAVNLGQQQDGWIRVLDAELEEGDFVVMGGGR